MAIENLVSGTESGIAPTELIEAVQQRRSIRHFKSEPVSEKEIDACIEIALWAPSPHNAQPWRVTRLGDTAKDGLARGMAATLRRDLEIAKMPPSEIARQAERSISRIVAAPAALLCSLAPDGLHFTGARLSDALEHQMAVQSVGAFLQTFFLAAHLRGIGTCWLAAPMYCREVVRETLHLPDSYSPQALVLMGYPASPGRVRPRRDASQILSEV